MTQIAHFDKSFYSPSGLATKTPVGQRKLKTPQGRFDRTAFGRTFATKLAQRCRSNVFSDEEAEAEPTESEVASPLGKLYTDIYFNQSLSTFWIFYRIHKRINFLESEVERLKENA